MFHITEIHHQVALYNTVKGKGKVIPLQVRCGLEGG